MAMRNKGFYRISGIEKKDTRKFSYILFEKDIPEEILEELMKMDPVIRKAEEKLEYLSSDPEVISLYKAREDSLHEGQNLISTGIKKGFKKGFEEGKLETKSKHFAFVYFIKVSQV